MANIEIIPESLELIRLSDEEYFSDKYKDYISNSKLSLIDPNKGGSKQRFLEGFPSKFSESFALGGAIHCMLLQPDDFVVSPLNKPTGKLGEFVNDVFKFRQEGSTLINAINKAKESANYYQNSLTKNRLTTAIKKSLPYYLGRLHKTSLLDIEKKETLYLSKSNKEKLNECLSSIKYNNKAYQTLNPVGLIDTPEIYNEYAIFCTIKVDGVPIKIKAKLDNFVIDHEQKTITLNDLKSTGKPGKFFMGNFVKVINGDGNSEKVWYSGSFQKYNYYRQMGLYLWLLNAVMIQHFKLNYTLKANIVVVETIPKYASFVYEVKGNHIKKGLAEFKELINLVVNG